MTASKLEESIREIVETTGLNFNWSLGASKRLEDALRDFAEAVRENSTCGICMLRDDWVRENLCAEHKRDAEPKECVCGCRITGCLHEPICAALPDEVKECLHQGFNIVDGIVRLCSLCHRYLGLMYPPKGGAGK